MQVGVTFPRDGLRNDPAAMRDFAQAAEALGYDHVSSGDHVVGRAGLQDSARPVIDPIALFSHLAAATSRIGLYAGVVVLPQRQTALFAKQAAGVDLLSGGRLRLALSAGWNELEYESLNEDFHNRGRRMYEQVAVLRAFWTQEVVNFKGRWHRIDRAGINPMPVQRPIPVWMAGYADSALRRVARLADGWIAQTPPGLIAQLTPDKIEEPLRRLRSYAVQAGRDPAALGLDGPIRMSEGTPDDWRQTVGQWAALGATCVTVATSRAELSLQEHIDAMRRFKESVVAG